VSINCPFYNKACILKSQVIIPDFKLDHDCKGLISSCSFFIKEKIKQIKADTKVKIFIRKVDNIYLVKADALIYPTNNLLKIDDPLLNRMTYGQAQEECDKLAVGSVKMGYPYGFACNPNWKIKQKYFINAVVAGASRLVNEPDITSAMKKTLIHSDNMGFESILIIPFDNGTHDINLTGLCQLSAIFTIIKSQDFVNLKNIYICMEDEESEQSFIEYYNRIFGSKDDKRNKESIAISS
jgi:hypothetical protein